ncbi:hypothetical protein ACL90Y_05105 [Micrococcus luteus]
MSRGDDPHGCRGDHDAEWEDIVARLRPDLPTAPPQDTDTAVPSRPVLHPLRVEEGDLPGDFVPPEPPALLSGRPTLVLSALALVLPLVVLLLVAALRIGLPGWASAALVLVTVCGGAGLFLQLPSRGDGRGDRLDRGAQV